MTESQSSPAPLRSSARHVLALALGLNTLMFFVGVYAGVHAQSTGLIGDAFDMLADASGYGLALLAHDRSGQFKRRAARWNGAMLVVLGLGVIGEVIRRSLLGSAPLGFWIIAFSLASLAVNLCVLMGLRPFRDGEIHMRAAWIDTRADVIVNLAVLASGLAIALTGWRYIDLGLGLAIGVFVIREGLEILQEARPSPEASA